MPEKEKRASRALLVNAEGFVSIRLAPSQPVTPTRWERFKATLRMAWSLTLIPLLIDALEFSQQWFRSKQKALLDENRNPCEEVKMLAAETRKAEADARLKELQAVRLERELRFEYQPQSQSVEQLDSDVAEAQTSEALKKLAVRRNLDISIVQDDNGKKYFVVRALPQSRSHLRALSPSEDDPCDD